MFLEQCASALKSLYAALIGNNIDPDRAYTESVRHIVRMLAEMIASEHISAEYGIFALGDDCLLNDESLAQAAQLLPQFQSMPISHLGRAYQSLLAFRPIEDTNHLEFSHVGRKNAGVYFTPPSLIEYIIDSVIPLIVEAQATSRPTRLLDPAMGGGDFLSNAVLKILACTGIERAQIAAECVYGVDIDPVAVEISRFCVWAASGFADGIADRICSHLICADALADGVGFDWRQSFPQVFADSDGFDAVVGNPPYIAAKNGLSRSNAHGQSDSYILFLESAMDGLIKPGGMLSMVLPDPMLVRENAAEVRRKLVSDWTILSILHISGVFKEAKVANIVPVCRNEKTSDGNFLVSRIRKLDDRRKFALQPKNTAQALSREVQREVVLSQNRCEFLYLLEDDEFGKVIRQIHGEDASLSRYMEPYVPLKSLNIKAIYRGEEIGKSAIAGESGELPIILGGQSIKPFQIVWEGLKTSRLWVKKPLERYHNTKIILQKSSARLIAALDEVAPEHSGYIFPQSVYGIELCKPGVDEIYLLCILNSQIMNEYIYRTVTGYKLVQPQIELEDIRALPIRRVDFTTPLDQRKSLAATGTAIFKSESMRGDAFPELSDFVAECESDVTHDVLVHIGRRLIDLMESECISPNSKAARDLNATRAAIETILWRLYSP